MVGADQDQGAVYLFPRPTGGWSDETEAAKLIASDGASGDYFGSSVAISGDTVVAGSAGPAVCTLESCPGQLPSDKLLYLFSKPRGGWSGTVQESARLTVSDSGFAGFGAVAMSGDTIVAFPLPQSAGNVQRTLYVFTRPAAGWSGTLLPSGTLTTSGGLLFDGRGPSMAISGSDIFVSGATAPTGGAVFVFHRPSGGWTGVIHEQARLEVPSSPSLWPITAFGSGVAAGTSGSNGVVNADVFTMPSHGWSGSVRVAAMLRPHPLPYGGETNPYIGSLAASDSTIAALVLGPTSSNCFPTNVCGETLYAFSRPRRGWRGTITTESGASAAPPTLSAYPLAVEGSSIATGGGDGAIDIFTDAASINALLAEVLTPTGKVARIGPLLNHGGYTYSLRTVSGGRMIIAWYYLPKGANLNKPNRKPKPVLAAAGNTRFAKPAGVSITMKLTKSGKRILTHATRLQLTAKGTYTPTGHASVTATEKLTLKR